MTEQTFEIHLNPDGTTEGEEEYFFDETKELDWNCGGPETQSEEEDRGRKEEIHDKGEEAALMIRTLVYSMMQMLDISSYEEQEIFWEALFDGL